MLDGENRQGLRDLKGRVVLRFGPFADRETCITGTSMLEGRERVAGVIATTGSALMQ